MFLTLGLLNIELIDRLHVKTFSEKLNSSSLMHHHCRHSHADRLLALHIVSCCMSYFWAVHDSLSSWKKLL